MDFVKFVHATIEADRAKEMLTSDQLTISELILKLEAVKNKELPIVFDDQKYKPTGLGSWRGSYREMAINYEDGGQSSYLNDDTCKKESYGDSEKYHSYECKCFKKTSLSENPTAEEFLKVLKETNGRYFCGYKGGDFLMGKGTPIWVANYGESNGYISSEDIYNQAVVDVEETPETVILVTKGMNY